MRKIAKSLFMLIMVVLVCFTVCLSASACPVDLPYLESGEERYPFDGYVEDGYFKATRYHGLNGCVITSVDESVSGNVVIPAVIDGYEVVKIANDLFANRTDIETIIISDGVNEIGRRAFINCIGLKSVTIPASVTKINENAFKGCTNLETVTFRDGSVATIGYWAFSGCTALKSITIPVTIGEQAFANCSNLESVMVSGKDIGKRAFLNCKNLKNITISDSVNSINYYAFENCTSLKSVTIPESVTSIGEGAFFECTALQSITVDENNAKYSSDSNGVLFNKDKTKLIQYPVANARTSYEIPDTVTTIGCYAFKNSKNLTEIKIPDSVTNIGCQVAKHLADNCINLKKIVTDENNAKYTSDENGILFDKNKTTLMMYPAGRTNTSYIVPETVTAIYSNAFTDSVSLKDIYYLGDEDKYLEPGNATLHYCEEVETEATCTAAGNVKYVCTECSSTVVAKITSAALGHNMGGYVIVKKPTATTEGVERSDCSRCDYFETRTVPVVINIYNIGEETYRFENFGDSHSAGGHCFGMSITSSGYYIGSLDKSIIGGNSDTALYSFSRTSAVQAPICHYHKIQGPGPEQSSMVAGGSIDLKRKTDTSEDWNACVNYVKSHNYDNKGSLQIGMWFKGGGGHAVNFLYYANVDGQDRIYAYDNNLPETETYYYMGSDGYIHQYAPGYVINRYIIGFNLTDAYSYFNLASEFKSSRYIYANKDEIIVDNAVVYDMKTLDESGTNVMFEIPEDAAEIKILPLVDNATFEYLDSTYSFGEVNEETYGKLSLTKDGDSGFLFEIVAGDNCDCKCHKGGIAGFFYKIVLFFQKLFGQNKVCACGVKH